MTEPTPTPTSLYERYRRVDAGINMTSLLTTMSVAGGGDFVYNPAAIKRREHLSKKDEKKKMKKIWNGRK